MDLITPEELEVLAEGIRNKNHASEVIRAQISYALSRPLPQPPNLNERNGPCCSDFDGKHWLSTGCDCGNTDDAEDAEYWRAQANKYLEYQRFLEASKTN